MINWLENQQQLAILASRQLFFIGGAPRSGTTWLQQMLDAHPDICCRGEGFFKQQFAEPIDRLLAERRQLLEAKNTRQFQHTQGYPLPDAGVNEMLLGSAVLLSLQQQCAGQDFRAIGEKTPENVFLFPRLKNLFPQAKFIGVVRDPRDQLVSAWLYFHKPAAGDDQQSRLLEFIRQSCQAINHGTQTMLQLRSHYPNDQRIVSYEAIQQNPAEHLSDLFRFLGVSAQPEIVADCLARTSFAAMTQDRQAGEAQPGAFLRKGVVGDWRNHLTPAMQAVVEQELGWMFPLFGWQF